uniref:Uncharacterized protein n=1 Tax=Anguilla anguilla TaxID=7936 RepID=A0A0E9WWT7_ANGAN
MHSTCFLNVSLYTVNTNSPKFRKTSTASSILILHKTGRLPPNERERKGAVLLVLGTCCVGDASNSQVLVVPHFCVKESDIINFPCTVKTSDSVMYWIPPLVLFYKLLCAE